MPKSQTQRVQDSVHGLMEFVDQEAVVIELLRTNELQRLRRIRQMGLAYQVYPAAEHSRLVHALGAAHLAIRFGKHLSRSTRGYLIESLRPNEEAIRDLAVAALCHDIGHGPLSHLWEREVIGEDYDVGKWIRALGLEAEQDAVQDAKWHELVGYGLLAWEDGRLHQLLEQHERGFSIRLRSMLRGKYYLPYLPRLLSSDVDVDRADFLIRDAHQSGVAYGRYDIDWLISTCIVGRIGFAPNERLVVGFDVRKAVRVVEQFLVARNALYENVYFHKTVRSAEGMIGLLLRRLKELGEEAELTAGGRFLAPYGQLLRGEALSQRDILMIDDYSLFILIDYVATAVADETARDLAQRILARDLFKVVPVSARKVSEFLLDPDGHAKMYRAVQPFCPGLPRYYVYVDRTPYSIFSEAERELGYFIDSHHTATEMRRHQLFANLQQQGDQLRLFTIRDGVDALVALLG